MTSSFRSKAPAATDLDDQSPIQVHALPSVCKRAPEIGEHNEEVLGQLGFNATESIACVRGGAIPKRRTPAAYAMECTDTQRCRGKTDILLSTWNESKTMRDVRTWTLWRGASTRLPTRWDV